MREWAMDWTNLAPSPLAMGEAAEGPPKRILHPIQSTLVPAGRSVATRDSSFDLTRLPASTSTVAGIQLLEIVSQGHNLPTSSRVQLC